MKIKCISSNIDDVFEQNSIVGNESIKNFLGGNNQMFISPGKEYFVYAITFVDDFIFYYIAEDIFGNERNYPVWYPAEFFKVINNNLSKTWIFNVIKFKDILRPIIAFPEWANDDEYYECLADGKKEAYEVFMKYKKIIDVE